MTDHVTFKEDDMVRESISVKELAGYRLVAQDDSTFVSLFHRKGSALETYDVAANFFAALFIEAEGDFPREVTVPANHPALVLRKD